MRHSDTERTKLEFHRRVFPMPGRIAGAWPRSEFTNETRGYSIPPWPELDVACGGGPMDAKHVTTDEKSGRKAALAGPVTCPFRPSRWGSSRETEERL